MNSKMSSNTIEQSKLPSNDEIISYLNNTATSIRTKSNTTEELSVQEFSSSIDSIPQVINNTFITSCPIGVILAWSSDIDSIPKGWHICDGTEGTIDLRDKFILGVGSSHGYGTTGGEETHTLTVPEMPTHSHIQQIANNLVTSSRPAMSQYVYANANSSSSFTGNTLNFEATGRMNVAKGYQVKTVSNGDNQPHNNMPPYYTLYFIQKIAQDYTEYTTISEVNEIVDEAVSNIHSINIEEGKYNRIGNYLGKPLFTTYRKDVFSSLKAGGATNPGFNVPQGYTIIDYDSFITINNRKYKIPYTTEGGLQSRAYISGATSNSITFSIKNDSTSNWENIVLETVIKAISE